ncbi:nucleotide pyrophosphohydrolase [Clostridium botulinum]|uniref:MazG nucleotide pyrophosphohydrolase domain family n=1 Tax=Clostridium botulinum (strain 657 / Type Ba4) TaxID=515621 RepID=A0A3F2ZYN1_CLOB6|nr:MazG nucleotide pyrophosphohydrolase domain-containing protein [Clostridium botulinum]ACQ52850.1 MazG nucleotide pyrophosphohydrolase domain family [Clostridium botulinum Ba4 str. 657]AXG94051.1 nucleotide pyrophosphohydrolase [Clostridium botulinum]MBY6756982.1 nucleotide pyrophosphohydrolase [Clostridium botulinum]
MGVKELVQKAYENAKKHGFWEDINPRLFNCIQQIPKGDQMEVLNALGNRLMLITGEVAEAHKAIRKRDYENFKEELADIVIRVADLAGGLDIDLEKEIKNKMEKNKIRPYKHGKAF